MMSVQQQALELVRRAERIGQRGQVIPPSDLADLTRDLGVSIPAWLFELLTTVPLAGLEFGWQEDAERGLDGVAWLIWSDARNIRSESLECYPGRAILPMGYICVASCSAGSGDPYFITIEDGDDPPLYRIYHDVSDHADAILDGAKHLVVPSLSAFFREAKLSGEGAA